MNEKPREILCDIIRDYGRTVVQEPKRCKALLLDLCGEHRREINVLMSAMDERIASDLLNAPSNVPHAVLLPQLVKRLVDDTGIATEYAQWAVESWALALGVITSVPTAPKPAPAPAPQPAPAPAPQPAPKPAPAPPLPEPVRKLVAVVENLKLPAAERVEAGRQLGTLGDPRPGVCTLPPAMVRIEGGRFVIGNPREQAKYDREINDQPMTIATFELARYPLTNAQYKLFIDDDGYNPARPWWDEAGRAWLKKEKVRQPRYWDNERFGIARPNHPVVGISWYEAVAFCRWLTQKMKDRYIYRLPTEAEWEYAARRNTGRRYPWGNEEPDGERANYDEIHGGTTAVGSFPKGATPDGLYDLAGNVLEWTGSVYKPYPYNPQDGREDTSNPANKRFVFRGGGWYTLPLSLRASFRFINLPGYRYLLGLRPARHLP